MLDLISDVNYRSWSVFVRYRSYYANDVSASYCVISSFYYHF